MSTKLHVVISFWKMKQTQKTVLEMFILSLEKKTFSETLYLSVCVKRNQSKIP